MGSGLRRRYPRHIRQSIFFGTIVAFVLLCLYIAYLVVDHYAITLARKPGYLTRNNQFLLIREIENFHFDDLAKEWGQTLSLGLSQRLSQHPAIRLIDSRSTQRLVNAGATNQGLFDTVQADYLLDGGVMRLDEQVVVTLHLYRSDSRESVWAKSYAALWQDREAFLLEVIAAVYRQLDERIFPKVKRMIEQGRRQHKKPPEAAAVMLFYQAHKLLATAQSSDSLIAELLLRQALAVDAKYAKAQALLVWLEYQRAWQDGTIYQNYERYNDRMNVVLKHDAGQGLAYAVKADIAFKFRHNMPVAELFYQQGIHARPSDADLRLEYAAFLMANSRYFDANAQIYAAKRLNPVAYPVLKVAWLYTMMSAFDLAQRELDKITPVSPVDGDYYAVAAQLYQSQGNVQQAFANYLNIFKLSKLDVSDTDALLNHYQRDGFGAVGRYLALERKLEADIGSFTPPLSFAYYLAVSDQPELALDYIEQAYAEKQYQLLWAMSDPRLNTLKKAPRFIAVIERLGLDYPQ